MFHSLTSWSLWGIVQFLGLAATLIDCFHHSGMLIGTSNCLTIQGVLMSHWPAAATEKIHVCNRSLYVSLSAKSILLTSMT